MKRKRALICGLLALLSVLIISGCAGSTEEGISTESNYNEGITNEESAQGSTPASDSGEFFFSNGLDENGFWHGVNVFNYVEIFDYQALQIPPEVHQVSEQSIQEIIDEILFNHSATEQITDREVADGDTINIDFVGSVDGVEFDGGSTFGMGTYVTIGVTQFIDDFLDQLIGHTPGTVVNVEVTFPDDYHEASLQGSDALFVTNINYIAGDEVLPELTDAFVLEFLSPVHGSTTVEGLIEDIHEFLQDNAIYQFIHEYLTTQVVISSVPEPLIRYHEQMMLQQYVEQGMQFGMDLESMLGLFGFESVEEFLEENLEYIESEARFSLVLQAVAEDAGITVSNQDVVDFFIEHFDTDDFSEFEEIYGLPWLKQFIRNQMVIDYISERVVLL